MVTSAAAVPGGSTGQGTVTDDECEIMGGTINGLLDRAQDELNTKGMTGHWSGLLGTAKAIQDQAEDAGCFFVNPL